MKIFLYDKNEFVSQESRSCSPWVLQKCQSKTVLKKVKTYSFQTGNVQKNQMKSKFTVYGYFCFSIDFNNKYVADTLIICFYYIHRFVETCQSQVHICATCFNRVWRCIKKNWVVNNLSAVKTVLTSLSNIISSSDSRLTRLIDLSSTGHSSTKIWATQEQVRPCSVKM